MGTTQQVQVVRVAVPVALLVDAGADPTALPPTDALPLTRVAETLT